VHGRILAEAAGQGNRPTRQPVPAAASSGLRPHGDLGGSADVTMKKLDKEPTPRRPLMSIIVRNATRRFGELTALDKVSVEVPSGSLTTLLGPAGGGKSTLLRVVAGLERPDAGSVEIAGCDATRLPPHRRGVGFVFQQDSTFPHLTVGQNLAFGLKVARRPKDEIRDRVEELLELVRLPGLTDRYPAELSPDQRQRLALGRSLATRPSVLLLDEPFGALDTRVRRELRAWLRQLHDELQLTTVLATHDQEEAMEVADRIVAMHNGRVEQAGGPRDLYEHPANAFVMGLLGPVTSLHGRCIRPHDLQLCPAPDGATAEAMVTRLVHLGFEVRADLVLHDGQPLQAQLSREDAEELELRQGQIVFVRPNRTRRFADAPVT
jgi:sulfate transport system ATP-binding protein